MRKAASATSARSSNRRIKVRVDTTVELAYALDRIRAIPAISHTNSTVVLRTVFERPITIEAGQPH
ncbi:hypothetical protein [Nonomuraea sp. NPDC049158]|uniref:hypothetical protein n=1 Tax=Nonomuraea sp. NPDC049158 TaxID=3155649 RepID=UPI0033F3FE59